MATPVIYLLIFIAVLLLVEGMYLLFFGKSISLNKRVNRRLEMLNKGERREEVLERLRKEATQHTEARTIPLYSLLATKAQKANIAFSPIALIAIMAFASFVAFVALSLTSEAGIYIRIALALGMGVGGVYFWVNNKAKKRMALMEEQLPDAVELMVRSLRVGHPLASAIQAVAREIPDPLGSEFGIIADEAAYGRNVSEAISEMAERLDMQDMRFLAVSVSIQQTSGGNLAEVLDGLSKVIRSRFRLFRRVSAITAEPRWSGIFLSAFPIAVLVIIQVISPHYYDDVKETTAFIPAAIVVFALLGANMIFMKVMTTIKV
ncbi:MAG: type II secretion system F family protein [Thioclava marina]|jgi:Flp pilus assembly protein TadB|uniref:Pilus assembly protein TadB n=1 Tax=Thioclava marina TaxID=1915077 RepID=A0ABX3MLT6_9RHOB|nr:MULTISPECIES: type II secretion system F family protein [Thioclava]TNE85206.1 MAG: pilus assembly protein TadB [Paracoccaceae bacterium]MBC7146203.1 type II secretion system F family protein [Thioclava marina]MBD3804401.1 type II secretion system F family protein [Thioclava sp.]OOY12158.1 pilus assembly protein TadB [Thioclava marina]OOY27653.1 pilus assembly protein TadB [Thioclava sp. L04-15]